MKKLLVLSITFPLLLFTLNCFAQLSVSTVVQNVHCYGQSNGSVLANPTGGTAPYTYKWAPGLQTTQTITGLTAATYTVSVKDHAGLTASATAIVTQPSTLIASVSAKYGSVCPGSSDSLYASGTGGTIPYQYAWTGPIGDVSCVNCQNTSVYPTGISYIVTALNDMNGCTASASVSVTVRPFPYVSITGSVSPIIASHNDTLVAVSPGASSYLWSNSATTNFIIVSPAVTTTYSVKTTNSYGCYDTMHYTVSPNSSGNGNTSSTAIVVSPNTNVTTTSYSTTDSVVWFSFVAANSNTQIIAYGNYLGMPVPHVHRLTLYDNSLQTMVDEPMPDITGANQIRIDASNLTVGNTYYVRVARCPAHANMAGCNPSSRGECNPSQRWDFQMCFRTVPVFVPDDSDGEAPAVSQLYYEHRGQVRDLNGIPRFDVKAYTNRVTPALYASDSAISFVYQHVDTPKSFIDTFQRVDMILTGTSVEPSQPVFKMEEDSNAGYLNYFLGYVPNGVPKVEGYSRLVYENVYPNVSMQVYSGNSGTKLYFICAPAGSGSSAGNPANIELQFKGATSVSTTGGSLQVVTELGTLTFAPGFAYTDSAGIIKAKSWQAYFIAVNSNTVRFNTGTYNTNEPLVIEVDRGHLSSLSGSCIENLCWSTYMGGSNGSDEVNGIYTDAQGNIYTAGSTTSPSFPVTNGVIQDSLNAGSFPWDATIVKYDVNTNLLWSTYYGGTDLDGANSVISDATGNVFVTGLTYSFNFPVQQPNVVQYPHAYYQKFFNGDSLGDCIDGDAFIVELNQSGTQKKWATWWGGCDGADTTLSSETYSEEGNQLVIDGNKNLYVVGGHSFEISKPTDPLVTKAGAYNDTVGTGFILKFNIDSSSSNFGNLEWATDIGGNNGDSRTSPTASILNGCALDNNNNLFVTGTTDHGGYPVGYTRSILPYEGNGDAVVTKFDATTDSIDWSTCYGSDNNDYGQAIAVSQTGNVYITGYTAGPFSVNIPLNDPNPGNDFFQDRDYALYNNAYTGFVAELNGNSGGIYWSTYFGGIDEMQLYGIALDADSDIYIAGTTGNAFPLPGAPVANTYTLSFTGSPNNPCLAEFNSSLQYGWGTCIDGTGNNSGFDVASAATVDKTNKRFYMGGKVINTGGSPYPTVQYGSGYIQTTNNEPRLAVTSFISMFDLSPIVTNVDNVDMKSSGSINVYPNPTTESITAEINLPQNEMVEFILYNMMGQVVYEKNISGQAGLIHQEIDLTSLPNGIYLLKVNENERYFTQKIVKQN